ncbi:hypothetical protein MYX07_02845 [Patescibacteria group bacterium AH-259-L07]|nr:hypothetical protein [Patescibacteria group bacterium AH-259-L07]
MEYTCLDCGCKFEVEEGGEKKCQCQEGCCNGKCGTEAKEDTTSQDSEKKCACCK